MEYVYFGLVAFLIGLAVFDLFVGVSNDAVNFLQSAVGARVASLRTVMGVASAGVLLGAVLSTGMMDVARHGIITPQHYVLAEVMVLFMSVMVTNVLVLHLFNTLGMPTSTTVSLVFNLLGGGVMLALIKTQADPSLSLGLLINADKTLQVIIAIFVSVAIAFAFGTLAQWLARVVFTFHADKRSPLASALFGGMSLAALSYFILLKGVGHSPWMPEAVRTWTDGHLALLMLLLLAVGTAGGWLLHRSSGGVFRVVVLMGTFALAMAFAGNDLVNFIGVPLAGLDVVTDYASHASGQSPWAFPASILSNSATTPTAYLLAAGGIMVVAMCTSKKARRVIDTAVNLGRQDEGDEMFGSSGAARSIVRMCHDLGSWASALAERHPLLGRAARWADGRFAKPAEERSDGAAFDDIRAAVSLVMAAMLIIIGTSLKLPLSTTYVTFMVAMGASLADRAWKRESAVYRVTGVISVIGGWFVTAGLSFVASAIVAAAMYYGGIAAQLGFIALVLVVLWRSGHGTEKPSEHQQSDDTYRLMMRTKDQLLVWQLLQRHLVRSQSVLTTTAATAYHDITEGLLAGRMSPLRGVDSRVKEARQQLRKERKQEMMALRRCPTDVAAERNTWFHVAVNASEQTTYCLLRMWEPIYEHVANGFEPLPEAWREEYRQVMRQVVALLHSTEGSIATQRFSHYREVLAEADELKNKLSALRKHHLERMRLASDGAGLQMGVVYLNLLQETQQLLSHMRHQLRGTKKMLEASA